MKDKKRPPNREFIYTILASLKPDFAERILQAAHDKRGEEYIYPDDVPQVD